MASTYSTNLGIQLIADGEQAGTWGQITNNNLGATGASPTLGLLEQAISGYKSIALTNSATTTLTIPDYADGNGGRNMVLEFTGGDSGSTVTVPTTRNTYAMSKVWFMYNNRSNALPVYASGASTTNRVVIPPYSCAAIGLTTGGILINLHSASAGEFNAQALRNRSILSTTITTTIANSTVTAITITNATGFPTTGYALLDSQNGATEVVSYTIGSFTTAPAANVTLVRGQLGTTTSGYYNTGTSTFTLLSYLDNVTYSPKPYVPNSVSKRTTDFRASQQVATMGAVTSYMGGRYAPIQISFAGTAGVLTATFTVSKDIILDSFPDLNSFTGVSNNDYVQYVLEAGTSFTLQNTMQIGSIPWNGTAAQPLTYLLVALIDPTYGNSGANVRLGIGGVPAFGALTELNTVTNTTIGNGSNSYSTVYTQGVATFTTSYYRILGSFTLAGTAAGTAVGNWTPWGSFGLNNLAGIGNGQTWTTTFTPARALSTTYYNTTGRPITVSIGANGNVTTTISVNGTEISKSQFNVTGSTAQVNLSAIVPVGSSYIVASGNPVTYWYELR